MDGNSIRLFAHFHLRVCFQFRAEQHYLCRIRGSFQYFSGSDGMHIDCTYINYYFRRYSAYSQSQQHHCTHHGLGVYFLALFIVIMNVKHLPGVIELIIENAFGWEQALGGGIGMALMQGIKRGLFSNEAGMGSAPNVAATADVTHPVKQGLIQTLGVFTDTLVICTCTAFIILFSGLASTGEANGIKLTQMALNNEIGDIGTIYVAVAILFLLTVVYWETIITAKPMYDISPANAGLFRFTASLYAAW